MQAIHPSLIGISAIAVHEPPWNLRNEWFQDILPRKFVQHTGIEARRISQEDEVAMTVQAVENLQRETGCDLADCAGLVLASSSLIPAFMARQFPDDRRVQRQRADFAARRIARRLGIPRERAYGINWGCSGYAKAWAVARRIMLPKFGLRKDQFLLIATAARSSKTLDYACSQTAGLFGDLAVVTMAARSDSQKYPVHFDVLFAGAETHPAEGVFFNYHVRENVLVPTPEGGRSSVPWRLVFSLDGMGIADTAPRAMAGVAAKALRAAHVRPEDVQFVIPHQAGTGIVRLAAMKLEEIGIRGEVINGMTRHVGNVVASSIPYALKKSWDRLGGIIICPTAGVGNPGDASVSQGCLILRRACGKAAPVLSSQTVQGKAANSLLT